MDEWMKKKSASIDSTDNFFVVAVAVEWTTIHFILYSLLVNRFTFVVLPCRLPSAFCYWYTQNQLIHLMNFIMWKEINREGIERDPSKRKMIESSFLFCIILYFTFHILKRFYSLNETNTFSQFGFELSWLMFRH